MDLTTSFLGLTLPHPFMAGAAQPLSEELDMVRRLEDAGAAAIVLHSLFEEQIRQEQHATVHHMEVHNEAYGEALSYFPEPPALQYGAEHYLEHVRRAKDAVSVPVIASLNGMSAAGWLDYARLIQDAGADALELNVYFVATDPDLDGPHIEQKIVDITTWVKDAVRIPVAVKLSPYFSSMANLGRQLDAAGADGLVLFNRFFQPDIDIENVEIDRTLKLSTPAELPLRLAWLGILSGRIRPSLAVTGGVHRVEDAVKAVMCGADAVQMVSALLKHGPAHLGAMRDGLAAWLEEHEYVSLQQMKGSMNLLRCPDPAAYQRANYMHLLQSWRP